MRRGLLIWTSSASVALIAQTAPAQRASTNAVTCSLAPANSQCQVQLGPKDTVVQITVDAPGDLTPGTEVTVSSDACCANPTRSQVDAAGLITIRWSAASKPDTTVHLFLVMPGSSPAHGSTRRGEVTLLPAKAAEIHSIHVRNASLDTHYVWLRNMYVPAPVNLDIDSLGRHPITDQADCEKIRVSFQTRVEAKATPDTLYALWIPGKPAQRGTCRAQTRWKLGDASAQQMDVTLSGLNMQPQRVSLTAFGRVPPRVVGGLGKFHDIVRDRDIQCTAATDDAACASLTTFPQKVTVTERRDGVEPYGAVEFAPLLFSHFRGIPAFLFRRLRFVGGTTLKHPEKNPFAGITVMPLFHPSLEETPFQFTVGSTLSGHNHLFYGVNVDANIILKPLAGIFGLGGG